MPNMPLPLTTQLALTLASLCDCRHLPSAHTGQGCLVCACRAYARRTTNDAVVITACAEARSS